jgi:hypothetical protein
MNKASSPFNNPPNNVLIAGCLVLSAFFSMFLIIEIIDASVNGIILASGLICVPMFLIFFREFIHRPKTIELFQDRILMKFRISKPMVVKYEMIKMVNVISTSDKKKLGQEDGEATLKIKGRFPYILRIQIGMAIREYYKDYYGTYPPGNVIIR